jgi:hypothetical protein
MKYTNIFHFKTLPNLPKLRFFVWKYTIWQPCSSHLKQRNRRDHRVEFCFRDFCTSKNFDAAKDEFICKYAFLMPSSLDFCTKFGQDDQMSLWKNSPKCSPTHFCTQTLMHNLNRGESSQKRFFLTFRKLPRVNNHPMGENSLNLATLIGDYPYWVLYCQTHFVEFMSH